MDDKTKRAMDEEQARIMGANEHAKHTPGPWLIQRGGNVPFRKAAFNVGDVAWIGPQRKVDAANANLISAAPELLDAAKEALLWIEKISTPIVLDVKDSLRLSINKAEGKNSQF